ncbi:MAG TPA: transporter [Chloroflexi bacterium]|nr:transporter [Chloroflexota bacterium]
MTVSARNLIPGKVVKVEHGAVNSEITIEAEGGVQIVSIITRHSAQNLDLEVGKQVYAVVKASNVMLATD